MREVLNMTNDKYRDIEKFGLNLYKIRNEKGITRQNLADSLGFQSERVIYDYENGIKIPKLKNLIKIVNILDVSLDSMFR